MDSIFQLDEAARALYLQIFRQSFGCTYICLWSYWPSPSNCLIYKDGIYHEETTQPSSSSASLSRRLFEEYQSSRFSIVDNECFPGFAFKNRIPYMELTLFQLLGLTIELQEHFYQEARIKRVIFMGCKTGEIELGFINETHMNTEMQMRNWFSEDFSTSPPLNELLIPKPKPHQNPEYSSSSSLRSSLGSPESSSILFNFPTVTSHFQKRILPSNVPITKPTLVATSRVNTDPNQYQQAMKSLDSYPTIKELEEDAIRSAYLAVISSLSSTSSSHNPIQQALPHNSSEMNSRDTTGNVDGGAFQKYRMEVSARPRVSPMGASKIRGKSLFKRAVSYFKIMELESIQERRGTRPTSSNQMHHMIAERRRREKLNESYDALRSLLPPGSKKNKASVLASTMEYMTILKAQVSELSEQNKLLEAKLSTTSTPTPVAINKEARIVELSDDFSSERLDIRITPISGSSSSEGKLFYLTMTVRGDFRIIDFTIRVLEFFKQVDDISLVYMEADPRKGNRSLFRLKVEGDEWDKSAFVEALKRIVADLIAHSSNFDMYSLSFKE